MKFDEHSPIWQEMRKIHIFILVAFIIQSVNLSSDGQDTNPGLQKLLDTYIKTGNQEAKSKIADQAPGSRYDKFCKAYELLDIDNKKGIELSDLLVREYPDFPEGYFALGTFMINGTKEYAKAVEYLDTAINLKPELLMAWFNRGIGEINGKEYEKAESNFDYVIQNDRGNAGAYVMRAVVNYSVKDFNALMSDIEIALQMDPYIISTLYFFQVRNAIDKAIEIAPDNVNLYYARGYANYESGYYRLAVNDFTKALVLVPGNGEYYKMLGASKIYLKDEAGAESDLKVAMGISPDDPQIYYYLGLLSNDVKNQPEMGYEYLTNAIELDQYNPLYYYERGWSSYDLFDYQEAFTDVQKALELDSRNGDFYTLRGFILLTEEVESDIDYCIDFKKAKELGTIYKLKKYIKKYCE